MKTVSLIVATVGRTAELEDLFDSLAAQTWKDFEVVVVDQNEDARLLPCLEHARQLGLQLKHIHLTPPNLSAARNAGIEVAEGRWIGFPDDDCWYDPLLLEKLSHRFRCDEALSGAAVQWVEEGVPANLSPNLTWERSKRFRDMPVASFQLFFHRKLFDRIGRFDCRLGVGLYFGAAEETDFVLRALRVGALVTFEPEAKVHHPLKLPPPTPQARQAALHRSRGTGALYAKHRLPLWVIVRGLLAPAVVPLMRGAFDDFKHGCAMIRGRFDGWMEWMRKT
jgi:glycosyltransferase involved in cell wall biosynthesis